MPKDPVAELRDAAWAAWCFVPMGQPERIRLHKALMAFDANNTLYCVRCKHRFAEGPYCSDPNCNCVCGG